MLRRAGYDDVTVSSARARRRRLAPQHLPRCRLRRPSHLYEFSFAPNPRWSRRYAPQAEIQAYLEDVARATACSSASARHRGARGALGRRARQVGAADERRAARGRRAAHRLRPALRAHGAGRSTAWTASRVPSSTPARWRHDIELAGRRVAVVGTAAAPSRWCPAIQPIVEHIGRLPALAGVDDPEDGLRLLRARPSGCSSASRCSSAWTGPRSSPSWSSARGDDGQAVAAAAGARARPADRSPRRSTTPSCGPR
jgi:hypothetical protein